MPIKFLPFLIIALAIVFVGFIGLSPAEALETGIYNVLHQDTAVYSESSYDSEVLARLVKDSEVKVLATQTSEGIEWRQVETADVTGYVVASSLYKKTNPDSFTLRYARITESKNGTEIYLYASPSADSAKLAELNDGVRVLLTGAASGDYIEVMYNGVRGYVISPAITRGLTYHQYLAIIVAGVSLVAISAIILLVYFKKNNKRKRIA